MCYNLSHVLPHSLVMPAPPRPRWIDREETVAGQKSAAQKDQGTWPAAEYSGATGDAAPRIVERATRPRPTAPTEAPAAPSPRENQTPRPPPAPKAHLVYFAHRLSRFLVSECSGPPR